MLTAADVTAVRLFYGWYSCKWGCLGIQAIVWGSLNSALQYKIILSVSLFWGCSKETSYLLICWFRCFLFRYKLISTGMFTLVGMADHFTRSRGEISKNTVLERIMPCTIASRSKDSIQSEARLEKSVLQMLCYSLINPSFLFLA